jgi:hypothetical protein
MGGLCCSGRSRSGLGADACKSLRDYSHKSILTLVERIAPRWPCQSKYRSEMAHVIQAGLRFDLDRLRKFHKGGTADFAASHFADRIIFLDAFEHLSLRFSYLFQCRNVAFYDVRKGWITAFVESARLGKFVFPLAQPCLRSLAPVEGLGLAKDDLPLFFDEDLREVSRGAVFTFSRYSAHAGTTFLFEYDNVVPCVRK